MADIANVVVTVEDVWAVIKTEKGTQKIAYLLDGSGEDFIRKLQSKNGTEFLELYFRSKKHLKSKLCFV